MEKKEKFTDLINSVIENNENIKVLKSYKFMETTRIYQLKFQRGNTIKPNRITVNNLINMDGRYLKNQPFVDYINFFSQDIDKLVEIEGELRLISDYVWILINPTGVMDNIENVDIYTRPLFKTNHTK